MTTVPSWVRTQALQNARERGCTCFLPRVVAMPPGEGEDMRVGIEHAVRCPLFSPVSAETMAQLAPDSVEVVAKMKVAPPG